MTEGWCILLPKHCYLSLEIGSIFEVYWRCILSHDVSAVFILQMTLNSMETK